MLRPFSFEKTGTEDQGQRNWRVFDENSKTITYGSGELSITSPVGTPTISQAFFTLYGPLVFVGMHLILDNGDGWTAGTSTILMPFGAVYTGVSKTPAVVPLLTAHNNSGVLRSYCYIGLGNTLSFATNYTSAVVAPQTEKVYIQGWYFRN